MNVRTFPKHLRALYANWFEHRAELWGGTDVLMISTATHVPNSMAAAFYTWLFGCNLPSTTAIFTPLQIHFLCTDSKTAKELEELRDVVVATVGADLTARCTFSSRHADHVIEVLQTVVVQTQREVARCSAVMCSRRSGGEGEENVEGWKCPVATAGCFAEEKPEWESHLDLGEAWKKKKLRVKGSELVLKDATVRLWKLTRIKRGVVQQQCGNVLEDGGNDSMDEKAPGKPRVAGELEGSRVQLVGSDGVERPILEEHGEEAGGTEDMAATCTWEKVPGCVGLQEDVEVIGKTVAAADLDVEGEWVLLGNMEF